MKIKNFLSILILVSGSAAFSQKKLNSDTSTVNALIEESKSLVDSDSAKAIGLAVQAKEMAIELRYPRGEANALKYIGMVYYMRGKYTETLDFWIQSLQVFESAGDDVGISNMLNNIGAIYLNQGADEKALEYMLKSLKLAEKTGDTLRIATALGNVGGIYHNKRDPVALNYLLKAIPFLEGSRYVQEYIGLTGNIGEIYFDNNNNEKALEYFRKSIKASKNMSEAFSYSGIGKVFLKEGNFEMALQNHKKALAIAEKADDKFQVIRSLKGLADVYAKQNNISLALEYYNKARKIAEEMDDVKIELKDLYLDMASAYAAKKDFSNAFLYKSLYSDIKDTLYTIETKKKLNQLQFDFELSKKEAEIAMQRAKIKSEKQARIGLTVGFGLLMASLTIYGLYRTRINQIKKEHKIRSKLASDLHDDLGGTLNSVKIFTNLALMESEKETHLQRIKQSTQEAISGLRDIMWVMDDKKDTLADLVSRISQFGVPLFESTHMQFKQEVSEDALNYRVGSEEKRNLYMIIKEAINNSVKHSGASDLFLSISLTKGKPTITVRDDGRGFDNATFFEGSGLKNMKMRAAQIHYELDIKSDPGTIIRLQKL